MKRLVGDRKQSITQVLKESKNKNKGFKPKVLVQKILDA